MILSRKELLFSHNTIVRFEAVLNLVLRCIILLDNSCEFLVVRQRLIFDKTAQ
jgi:hypothetical protein